VTSHLFSSLGAGIDAMTLFINTERLMKAKSAIACGARTSCPKSIWPQLRSFFIASGKPAQ
jgi:hypothetical protein